SSCEPQISCRPLYQKVAPKLRQKIWDGEFLDLSQILDEQTAPKYTLQLDDSGSVGLTQANQKKFLNIERWTDAFSIFSSVYRQKYPEATEGLATYQHVVRNIAKAGGAWYTYDTSFRRLKQTAIDMDWGSLEQELYCMAMTASKSKPQSSNRKQTFPSSSQHTSGNHTFRSNPEPAFDLTREHTVGVAPFPMSVENVVANTLSLNVPKNLNQSQLHPSNSKICSSSVTTPINVDKLREYLQGYSSDKLSYLIQGFTNGFHLHFQGERRPQTSPNLQSALTNPTIVQNRIDKEVELGRVKGPFPTIPLKNLKLSPLGLVPKKTLDEFRLIHHLSYPRNGSQSHSVNSGI
ncbi:uncharacterized protein, partial [Argopecten irradians]|uniref:uncharacterized protein n=1 Tax=Argopecten irradians TaxID=31199 RepID=UPI00371827C1